MSQSSRPENFFQTTSSLEEINRKAAKSYNVNGNPIKVPSKILAIAADPTDDRALLVAESAGCVRRVVLDASGRSQVFTGPSAPVTSVCTSPDSKLLFAGCWDKSIWSWNLATREKKLRYQGHSDFIKTVICAPYDGKVVLVSGAADASIVIWDIDTGRKIKTLKGHARGIQDLIMDPLSSPDNSSMILFSAGSDREIRRWVEPPQATEEDLPPILEHETSVYKLRFDADGDLWTASADGNVKNLIRERNWKSDTTLTHPDFVRDVVVDEIGGWVVTACRDEDVRVWNRASGELHHTFSGHFEEVTCLVLLDSMVISAGIDATIRQWSLRPDDLKKAKDAVLNDEIETKPEEPAKESMLTEEEERELAELLEED